MIAIINRSVQSPPHLSLVSTVFPLYTSLNGDSPSATPFGKIRSLPWASSDLSGSRWRNISNGDQKILLGDTIPPTLFFPFENGLRTDDWVRVDVLPVEQQLDWACFRLNWLESKLVDLRQKKRSTEAYETFQRETIEEWHEHAIVFYRTRQGNWRWRNIPMLREGDRVRVVWAEPGQQDDIGKIGTVGKPERYQEERIRVWLDDGILGRLILPGQLEIYRDDPRAAKRDRLRAELDGLMAQRDSILQEGEVRPGCWIKTFPTKKANGKECRNTPGGYAFWCWMQNGKQASKAIPPADLAQAEAIEDRTKRLKKISTEIKRMEERLERANAVCAGVATSYIPPDDTGKVAGQWDLFDTRSAYPAGKFPHERFAFVVFQWRVRVKDEALTRGKAYKKFPVPVDAPADKIEEIRQKALELIGQLGSDDSAKLDSDSYSVGDQVMIVAVQSHQSSQWIGRSGTIVKIGKPGKSQRVRVALMGAGEKMIELPLPPDFVVKEGRGQFT